jgi:signal transduction histidine kinase
MGSFLRRLSCFLAACCLSLHGLAALQAPSNVLFISSNINIARATRMSLAFESSWEERGASSAVYTAIVPAYSFPPGERETRATLTMLELRYADKAPGLIVAQGDSALSLAASLRKGGFAGATIVGIELTDKARSLYADEPRLYLLGTRATGDENVLLAHRLFPKRTRILVLATVGPRLDLFDDLVSQTRASLPSSRIEFVFNPTRESADAALRSERDSTVLVNFCPGWLDAQGRFISGKEFIRSLVEDYSLPVFEFLREDLGSGLVGGVEDSAESWGKAAAELAAAVLDGESRPLWQAGAVQASAFVDCRELERFGSSIALVPKGAELVNAPASLWERYRTLLQLALAAALIALVFLALNALAKRRERRILLRANEELELKVEARTQELQVYNEELSVSNDNLVEAMRRGDEMREKLLLSEREITLGRLAAGIANELNSPLAALRSASGSLQTIAVGGREDLLSLILGFDEAQRSAFARYAPLIVRAARAPVEAASTAASAAGRDELERRLAALGCAAPAATAADLAETRIPRLGDEELAAIVAAGAEKLARALYLLSILYGSAWIIDRATDRAAEAVKAVREYVSTEEDEEAAAPLDLVATIGRALSLFMGRRPASVSVRTSFDELPPFVGRETVLVRLWAHLIENALQAMASGGGLLLVSARREGDEVVVTVDDEGCGVPSDIALRLFEPFVTSRPPAEGMGLGLAYCKRIVDSLGGSIAYGAKARGSVFAVRLPLPA